jgi:transcriptional regulator with XRE-family HTH domain
MARGTGRPDRSALAHNVRRLRKQRKWSQERLAAEAGELRQSLISDLELAKANPTLITLESIAGALGVTVHDLFKPSRAGRRLR